jgi:hypothetical protein
VQPRDSSTRPGRSRDGPGRARCPAHGGCERG